MAPRQTEVSAPGPAAPDVGSTAPNTGRTPAVAVRGQTPAAPASRPPDDDVLELAGLEIKNASVVVKSPLKAATLAEAPTFGRRDEEARVSDRTAPGPDGPFLEPAPTFEIVRLDPSVPNAEEHRGPEKTDLQPAFVAAVETVVTLDVGEVRFDSPDVPPLRVEAVACGVEATPAVGRVAAGDVVVTAEVAKPFEAIGAVEAPRVAVSEPVLATWLAAFVAATRTGHVAPAPREVEPAVGAVRVEATSVRQPMTPSEAAELPRAGAPTPESSPEPPATVTTRTTPPSVEPSERARQLRWVSAAAPAESGDLSHRRARIEAVAELKTFSERPMALQPGFDAASLLRDLHEVMLAERGIVEIWRTMASSAAR